MAVFASRIWRNKNTGSQMPLTGNVMRTVTSHTYLKQPEPDQIAAWASRGAGLFTDEILPTVRDPTSLGAQR